MKNSPLKVSFILGAFITMGTGSFLSSSYAMDDSDNATPHHRVSIRALIQEGIEEYQKGNYQGAKPLFEKALRFLEDQIPGETTHIDFGGIVTARTVTFSPDKGMEQDYHYNSEIFSLEQNIAAITKLTGQCKERLQKLHSLTQPSSDEDGSENDKSSQ